MPPCVRATIAIEFDFRWTIADLAPEAVRLAQLWGVIVAFKCGGIQCEIGGETDAEAVCREYQQIYRHPTAEKLLRMG